jgi:acetylornithine deacetylase/succinyl-diaminopimelate desuccinylase-like protein
MAQILADIKGADGWVKVPGFYDDVAAPTPAERAALEAIPYDARGELSGIGVRAPVDGPEGPSAMERLMFLPTFNVTGIGGGYTGPGFKTVIPAEVVAQIDVRLVVRQDPGRMFALLRDWLAARAPDARLELLGSYQPSRTPMDAPAAAVVQEAVRLGFGQAPLLYPALGGSSPDAAFAQGLGIPSLLVPYGNPDERNHAPNENLRLDYLEAGARTSAALFATLGR